MGRGRQSAFVLRFNGHGMGIGDHGVVIISHIVGSTVNNLITLLVNKVAQTRYINPQSELAPRRNVSRD